MNFLFHLYLSGDDQELLVGNFMGDFVKGPLQTGIYPPRITQGLLLHRKIDSFAHHHSSFQASKQRLPARYGLYRGILVDLFYDHFLAHDWTVWADRPLSNYLTRTRMIVNHYLEIMPHDLQGFVPIIFNELLPSYQTTAGIKSALARMGRRITRPNPLAEGSEELELQYELLRSDFNNFMLSVQHFVTDYRQNLTPQHADLRATLNA